MNRINPRQAAETVAGPQVAEALEAATETRSAEAEVLLDVLGVRVERSILPGEPVGERAKAIAAEFKAVSSNPEALKNYTLANFNAHITELASLFPKAAEPLLGMLAKVAPEDFPKIKGLLLEGAALNDARIKKRLNAAVTLNTSQENKEKVGLGLNRMDALAAPDLNIGSLMAEIRSEMDNISAEEMSASNRVLMQKFREKMLPKVQEKLKDWARSNDEFVKGLKSVTKNTKNGQESESAILEKLTGVTTLSQSTVGKAAIGVQTLAGNLAGDFFASGSYQHIEDNQFLTNFFGTSATKKSVMSALIAGNFNVEAFTPQIESQLKIMFPDDLKFSTIGEYFGGWSGVEDEALTKEDLAQIQEKLKTIPRFFIGGEWEDKYYDYVRTEVGGKGAIDFPEWLLTQVDGIQYVIFTVLLQLTPALNWYYNTSTDTDEQRYGKHWQNLETLKGSAPKNRGDILSEVDPEGDETAAEKALIKKHPQYGELLKAYRNKAGADAEMDIKINGEPLTIKSEVSSLSFAGLKPLLEGGNAHLMLSKGLDLEDLLFVARHKGDVHADGINMHYGESSLSINYDINTWFDGNIAEIIGGAAGAGFAVNKARKLWKDSKLLKLLFRSSLAGIVKGGLVYAAGEFGVGEIDAPFSTVEINYSDDVSTIRSAIGAQREMIDDIKNMVMSDLEGLAKDPAAFEVAKLNEIKASSGFNEMLEDISEFRNGYEITAEDVDAFLAQENQSGSTGFSESSWFDVFHKEEIDKGDRYIDSNGKMIVADRAISSAFEVDGTGSWKAYLNPFSDTKGEDLKFVDYKGFFTWLKAQPLPSEE